MNTYAYSPSSNSFFPYSMKDDYENAGTWPADGIEVDESVFLEFAGNAPPEGKQRQPGKDGMPSWVDEPGPTPEEISAAAASLKVTLMNEASAKIAPLQDAVDLDMATEEEAAALTAWKKYRILLSRVDVSTAPDIEWPESPA